MNRRVVATGICTVLLTCSCIAEEEGTSVQQPMSDAKSGSLASELEHVVRLINDSHNNERYQLATTIANDPTKASNVRSFAMGILFGYGPKGADPLMKIMLEAGESSVRTKAYMFLLTLVRDLTAEERADLATRLVAMMKKDVQQQEEGVDLAMDLLSSYDDSEARSYLLSLLENAQYQFSDKVKQKLRELGDAPGDAEGSK